MKGKETLKWVREPCVCASMLLINMPLNTPFSEDTPPSAVALLCVCSYSGDSPKGKCTEAAT